MQAPIERDAVRLPDRLADPDEERRAELDRDVEREGEVVLDRLPERFAGREHQGAIVDLEREDAMAERELAGQHAEHVRRWRHEPPRRHRRHHVRLGDDAEQDVLAHRRELEQIRRQVPALEDLARDRVLHRAHRCGLSLDEQGA